jgi:hypothetical protein
VKFNYLFLPLIHILFHHLNRVRHRQKISLNATWDIVKTDLLTQVPSRFTSKNPFPGLVDMVKSEIYNQDTAYNNSIY